MRNAMILLSIVLTMGGDLMNPGDSHAWLNPGPRPAWADDMQVSMPKEAVGFRGTLQAEIFKPVANGCFTIRVIQVAGYSTASRVRLTAAALTAVWKDKYDWCGPARGAAALPELKVGDTILITCFQNEMHLRYSRVVKEASGAEPVQAGAPKAGFVMKTYTYKQVGDLKIEADVYRPDDAEPRPVLAYLHGGALMMGNKKGILPDLLELCKAEGCCLVSADYRLAPQAKLPQIIEDLRDFIRWISEKGPTLFHADAGRVVVSGNSAGGYLTMMAGLCEPRPKGLVAYYGYGDVDGPWYTTPSEFYRTSRPLVSREDAYKGMTPEVVTEPAAGGLNRGQLYLYFRQNGLWTKEVSRKTGRTIALPTEAQWEYAARAGVATIFLWGDSPAGGAGWLNAYDRSAQGKSSRARAVFPWSDGYAYTSPVGKFRPNNFGLYDMQGNASQ